jgi:hypothetical protein
MAEAFQQCINDNNGDLESCLSCMELYSGPFYPFTDSQCSAFGPYLCVEMENCPSCGPCLAEDVAWTNCLLESTCSEPYSCDGNTGPAPTPVGPSCSDMADDFVQCINDNNGDPDTCLSCIQSYSGPFYPYYNSECSTYEEYLCGEMENCPSCGPCLSEDLAWTNCLLESTCSDPYSCR